MLEIIFEPQDFVLVNFIRVQIWGCTNSINNLSTVMTMTDFLVDMHMLTFAGHCTECISFFKMPLCMQLADLFSVSLSRNDQLQKGYRLRSTVDFTSSWITVMWTLTVLQNFIAFLSSQYSPMWFFIFSPEKITLFKILPEGVGPKAEVQKDGLQ